MSLFKRRIPPPLATIALTFILQSAKRKFYRFPHIVYMLNKYMIELTGDRSLRQVFSGYQKSRLARIYPAQVYLPLAYHPLPYYQSVYTDLPFGYSAVNEI